MFEKLVRSLSYIRHLLSLALKTYPAFYLSLILIIVAPLLELFAMSSLMPLSQLVMGGSYPQTAFWPKIYAWLGIELTFQNALLVFLSLFLMQLLLNFSGLGLSVYLGKKLQAYISSTAFENIVKNLTIKEIEARSIGFFIRLAGDEASNSGAIVTISFQLVGVVFLSALYFAAIAFYSPITAVLVLGFLLISMLFLFSSFRKSYQMGRIQVNQSREAGSFFIDSLNGLRSVRSFRSEGFVSDRYRKLIFEYTHTLFVIDIIAILSKLAPVFVLFLAGFVWVIDSGQSASLSPELGAFVFTILVYLMRFFPTVGRALNMAMKVVSDASMGTDVIDIVRRKQVVAAGAQVKSISQPISAIQVSGLTYAHREGADVLKDVTYEFKSGSSYAIVGESGSGKSTLTDLILSFYSDFKGSIKINGVDIRELSAESVRSKVLLVGQSTSIYNDTIMANICFGHEASESDVKKAARLACIDDFIESLPEKYQTKLQYQGSNLSGGQKQRIALARAILRAPEVLILDESTSALDADTREKVVRNLLSNSNTRILIFVTHDKDLVRHVTHVLSLEKGVVYASK